MIFFIRQFYLSIPTSLEEAAMLDGCGRFAHLRAHLPAAVEAAVRRHGDHGVPRLLELLRLADPDDHDARSSSCVQQYLATFRSERSTELGLLMAGSVLAAAPVIILFLIFQRQIIGNIKMAGLK